MSKLSKALLIGAAAAVFGTMAAIVLFGSFRRSEAVAGAPAPELLSALPVGAPALVYIDLDAIRASSFYQHRPDKGPITVPDQNYSDFIRSTGFDFEKDLSAVAIASWPESLSKDQKKMIVVADGHFDRAKIRDYAVNKGKVERQEGREVLLFPTENPTNWTSVTFLNDHRIALVNGPNIAPLFRAGTGDSGNDPAREHAARVAGAAIFAVSRVPPLPDNFATGGMQSAQFATLARSIQWITIAAKPVGDNVRVSIEGECATSTDARQIQTMLEVLRMFGEAALQSPKTRQSMDPAVYSVANTLLKNADVTATAERVRILVQLTPDVLNLKSPPTIKKN